jgi:two-component system, LytTR family, sensor kinase
MVTPMLNEPAETGDAARFWSGAGAICAFCLLLGVLSVAQLYSIFQFEHRAVALWRLVAWQGSGWFFWAVLTPAVWWWCRLFPLVGGRLRRSFPAHLGLGFGLAFMQGLVLAFIRFAVPLAEERDFSLRNAAISALSFIHVNLLAYWAIVGANFAFEFYRRWQVREVQTVQLREDLLKAQLQALQMQLHPHFLFNTLHTIATLVGDEPALARRMIARLGDFLRLTLNREATQFVPLASEVEFVRAYLAIEEVRFQDRLRVAYHIDASVQSSEVPSLILQPLVENAIRHGLSGRAAAGVLELRALRVDDRLRLEVRDSGGKLNGASGGLGVQNTKSRLARLYGAEGRFSLAVEPDGHTVAAIDIPFTRTP